VEGCENSEAVGRVLCDIFDLPQTAVKVVAMKELPRTLNGKLDYQRLADADGERMVAATG